MKKSSDVFIKNQSQENREIVDLVSGIIFQTFPNIKERISKEKLKYIEASKGYICSIYIYKKIVILEFRSGIKFNFETINSINKKHIEIYLKK